MSETRHYCRAECSEEIRLKAADFIVREKSRQGIKTSVLVRRLSQSNSPAVYNSLSRLHGGDTSGVGLEYLLRLVEAVGYTVKINFVPKVTESSRRVAA